jgi:hypothetical protein
MGAYCLFWLSGSGWCFLLFLVSCLFGGINVFTTLGYMCFFVFLFVLFGFLSVVCCVFVGCVVVLVLFDLVLVVKTFRELRFM